ncbi:hypothetical protein WEU38_11055 [Cyanobacterium aponinum AL20118]|uniref:Uncharacterized protein n=1 Tax=Cyanobacterium aponinum AL20115 TaxID=3090662 RepID=A0AAF0ZBW8_9CHRO|nr:hypothetical protein [Cyanobacterium aponinum]WPF87350.1 hypothetical protein SAY89_11085 [Cyanobacterium aponinum AL20115]
MQRNYKILERRKEVFKLCKEAEAEGITSYPKIANYVYEKTGKKCSYDTIQAYKLDKIAQEKATGILITEKQLIKLYLDNPQLLFPEYLEKIKNTKFTLKKNIANIITWAIAIIITVSGYLAWNNRQLILNLGNKTQKEEIRLTLNKDYTTSIFKGINKPLALVYGYLYIDFIEELSAPPQGILLNKDKGLVIINNVPITVLINYLDGQYAEGELIITGKQGIVNREQ